MEKTKSDIIAELNDKFRSTLKGGKLYVTCGINALGYPKVIEIIKHVCAFNDFNCDNDPYFHHDFGSFDLEGEKIWWKIDYYDTAMEWGSPDPTDEAVTTRVLTVLLSEER